MSLLDEIPAIRPLATIPRSTGDRIQELKENILNFAPNRADASKLQSFWNELLAVGEVAAKRSDVIEQARWGKILPQMRLKVTWEGELPASAIDEFPEKIKEAVEAVRNRWRQEQRISFILSGDVASFLQRATSLEARGNIDGAIDLVNDSIDELFRRGYFPLCDSVLAEIDPKDHSTDILLTILTATAVAKSRLKMRRRFFVAAKKAIKSRKEYELGLLDGLE